MKSILWLLLAFYAASNAAPVGILREGRYAVKVEVTAASTSQFTNKAVTVKACCLDTTTDVDAWQATQDMALSSFFADSTPRKLASSCGICLNGSGASGHNRGRNQLHRISLTGVRDLVAVVMLGFAVVSGFACSCLRSAYIASLRDERADDAGAMCAFESDAGSWPEGKQLSVAVCQ